MRRYGRSALIGLLGIICLALLVSISAAQTSTGQLCLRAFEDRNGNEQEDPGEPRITQNLTATLYNARGVAQDAQFMADSPNAASGTLCFQRLEAGTYTIRVSAVNYNPTTPTEFVAEVSDTGRPPTFLFGGQRVAPQSAPPQSESAGGTFNLSEGERRAAIQRILIAGIGAVVAVVVMAIVGTLLYFLFFRDSGSSSSQPAPAGRSQYAPPPDTGDTSSPAGSGIEFPPVDPDEDTGRMQPIRTVNDSDTDVPEAPASTVTEDSASDDNTADDDFTFEPLDATTDEPDNAPDTDTPTDDDDDDRFRPPQN